MITVTSIGIRYSKSPGSVSAGFSFLHAFQKLMAEKIIINVEASLGKTEGEENWPHVISRAK